MADASDPRTLHVPNVQRKVLADGSVALYLRKRGFDRVTLTSPWGTQALLDEVATEIERQQQDRAAPGTLDEALTVYETQSPRFLNKAESTKATYRVYIKQLSRDVGDLPVEAFQPVYLEDLKNAWAPQGYRAANMLMQVLKNALRPAMIAGKIPADAFALVGRVERPASLEDRNLPWPDEVVSLTIERALEKKLYGLARGIAILRYVGPRRTDVVRMTKNVRIGGRFRFMSGKKSVPVDVAEDPELTRLLATIPDTQPDDARLGRKLRKGVTPMPATRLVFNLANKPYTSSGLYGGVKDILAELFEEGLIESSRYSPHGLRHTRGIELALAGSTDPEGAAMLGHDDPRSFAVYRRHADRLRLADNAAQKIRVLRASQSRAGAEANATGTPVETSVETALKLTLKREVNS